MSRFAALLIALLSLLLPRLALADACTLSSGAVPTAAGFNAALGCNLKIDSNLSDLPSPATARTNLGLGSIATQAASGVAITGGTIAGTTISLGAAGGANVTATGGTTARTLAAWMADRRNVKSLGAAGDGTTVDLTAITTGTSPWYLPDGTFSIGNSFAYLSPGTAIRRWSSGGGTGRIKTTEGLQSGNIAVIKQAPSYTGPGDSIVNTFNGDMQCALCFQTYVSGASTLGTPATGYQYNFADSGIIGAVHNASGYSANPDTNSGRTALQAVTMKLYQAGMGDLMAYGATGYVTGVRPNSTYFLGAPVANMIAGDFAAGVDGPYLDVDEIQIRDNGYMAAAAGMIRNFYRNATGDKISPNWPWMGVRLQSVGDTPIDVFYSMAGPARMGIDFTTVQGHLIDYTGASTGAAIVMGGGQKIYGNATNANLRDTNMPSDTVLGTETFGYTAANGWNAVVGGTPILSATAAGVSATALRITAPTVPSAANDTCAKGQIAYDTGYLYICTANDNWKRAALATWP